MTGTSTAKFAPGVRNVKLSLDGLAPGMYFYSVETNGEKTSGKLIVR